MTKSVSAAAAARERAIPRAQAARWRQRFISPDQMLAASRGQTKDRREESIPGSILFGCNWVNLWVDNRVCFPFSSLESVIEHSKEGYDLALRQTQGAIRSDAPDWQPWLSFFLRALQQQVRRLSVKLNLHDPTIRTHFVHNLHSCCLPGLQLHAAPRLSRIVQRAVLGALSRPCSPRACRHVLQA